jgi:cation diffusion facilitator CzcD-associated flavoprotein CzcO
VKQWLQGVAHESLGDGDVVNMHFTPTYNPWDQRMCLMPDGDIVVTTTGLDLEVCGATLFGDVASVDFSKIYTYKGMMYSCISNLPQVFGYMTCVLHLFPNQGDHALRENT